MADEASSKLQHLVVDSGAIIKGTRLEHAAENYWTVGAVVQEIRDGKSRERLSQLPFQLQVREPSEEALRFVSQFARKTGDFRGLSPQDLQVLALTYMLEKENRGVAHLRTEPVSGKVEGSSSGHFQRSAGTVSKGSIKEPCKFFFNGGCRRGRNCPYLHTMETEEKVADVTATSAEKASVASAAAEAPAPKTSEAAACADAPPPPPAAAISWAAMAQTKPTTAAPPRKATGVRICKLPEKEKEAAAEAEAAAKATVVEETSATMEFSTSTKSRILTDGGGVTVHLEEEGDDEGWINGDNKELFRSSPFGNSNQTEATEGVSVGCITTDFAMQNVLLQIGLRLLSLDGMAIRRLKQWVLKCIACMKVTTDMDRLFCPVCGNSTLEKVSVSVGSNGEVKLHTRRHQKNDLRGTKFSIPTKSGGRFDGGLLLREDQLLSGIWRQKAMQKTTTTPMFGEDVSSNLVLSMTNKVNPDVKVGYGRRNPNSTKGRERRGKKKRSS